MQAIQPLKLVQVIFFFFQAEDGIRDSSVTGVQTCALPISQQGLGDQGREHVLRNTGNGGRAGARPDFQKKYSYFPSIQKPVIAAVNGPAVGLGFIITLYCDLRFASDSARFGTAFAKRGLIAEYGISWM